VTPLSHEISEWRNDPFVNNLAPAWQFPNGRGCEGNLETGDPIKVLSNSTGPVTLNGFTYIRKRRRYSSGSRGRIRPGV